MKNAARILLIAIFTLMLPLVAVADKEMDHGMMKDAGHHGKMEGMDHDGMKGMDHDGMKGMKMGAGMLMLGTESEDGVEAMAHAKVYDEAARASMEKMGMSATHHFMIMFKDEKTGAPVTGGLVAVKIKPKNGEAGKAIKLMPMKMGMGEGFGGDINLPAPGEYEIKVGSKLADGKKRQFKFEIRVE
ncbi:hypothetical protein EDC39_10744 [Geothermobacter ehrlichii]|uniref:YtkA-like protein n=1 Tax=Geothermobacter ehrlichii TaxID=213224 RepID=A0A5D3WHB8_9BACT|nr:hypothetical protein [Geothermobacter ehrlichii]TYO98249.1 hypothetical protein EDC39_10744 [Geothermobacter ehrlichii]